MSQWTVKRGDQQANVGDLKTLLEYARSGRLRRSDLVRNGDVADWVNAGDIAELQAVFSEATETMQSPVAGFWRQVIVAVIVGLALAAITIFWMWTRTPQHAIRQIERAIVAHDIERFRKYVDLDGVAADSLALVRANAPDAGPLDSALTISVAGSLQEGFKRAVTNMVESQEAGPPRMVYDFIDRESTYSGVDYIKRDGKVATVGLKFTTPNRVTKVRVYEVRMRDLGSYWQVAGLNVGQMTEAKIMGDAAELVHAEEVLAARVAKQIATLRLSLDDSDVVAGPEGIVTGTISIAEPASAPISVTISAESLYVRMPQSVAIPAGQTTTRFIIHTFEVPNPIQITVHAGTEGKQLTAPLLLNLPRPIQTRDRQPREYEDFEDVYLDKSKLEYHVSTCEIAKAAARGQRPTWNYRAMIAQGIRRAEDCANLPIPKRKVRRGAG